jgi:uncharacterized protein YdeI (YjbR/CyaY-like superfamily)
MPKTDPRIDAYIRKAAPFAQPILTRIRKVVHTACPEVEETLKWRHPTFMYKGMLGGFAAFKAHATFGFWKHELLVKQMPATEIEKDAWGQFGRLTSVDDMPDERTLMKLVKAAAALNDAGVKVERMKGPKKPPVKTPADLAAALRHNKKAAGHYEAFSPSKKRDYVEWLTEAKSDDTRARRLETAVGWIAEGKSRNWKYE